MKPCPGCPALTCRALWCADCLAQIHDRIASTRRRVARNHAHYRRVRALRDAARVRLASDPSFASTGRGKRLAALFQAGIAPPVGPLTAKLNAKPLK